ncbi:MAG TPA: hypothetical protein VGL82_06795 [Bryobacteraceae bacterium]
MKHRFMVPFFALAALLALTQFLFAQRGQQAPAPQAPSNEPFDPHDISGIWKNPGGFDVALGNNRPPMTDWGKEKWSKTRASARNSPLSFGFYKDQKDWNDPLFQCDPSGYPRNLDYRALRRNPIDAAIDGVWGHPEFRYTPWIEKQRLDKDSRLVGVSGISK